MAIVPLFLVVSGALAGAETAIVEKEGLSQASESSSETELSLFLDSRKQLFLDDYLIASMKNVSRTIHPARKFHDNPVLSATEPWEGTVTIVYGSVILDGEAYRMWYHGGPGVCYAESNDGVQWTKPRLGIIDVDGHPTNVVVDRNAEPGSPNALPQFYEVFGVFKDPGDADPARRYKMGHLSIQRDYHGPRQDPFHGGQRRGLGVAASPDGIHWTAIETWATEAICDGATHWMFDPAREAYILYGRTKYVAPEVKEAWAGDEWVQRHFWGRSVARVESQDFLHWDHADGGTAPVVMTVDTNDTPGNEIYSMCVFPYESVYIGLVQVFHNRPDGTLLDIQLAVSHDSIHFTRIGDRTPFIPCGPAGTWDRFNNSIANNPPIRVGDMLRFYYGGRTYRHGPYTGADEGRSGGAIGFAEVPRERFVSLGASFDGGAILTKPLRLTSPNLHINANAAFGAITVEALDVAGEPVAITEPIRLDAFDIPLQWTDSPPDTARPITLRIRLENAQVFAIWCT